MITISDLFIYPVKSFAGIRLHEAELDDYGFRYDRAWMVTDLNGNFLTQRQIRTMALMQTALASEHLLITAPDGSACAIDLKPQQRQHTRVMIWDDIAEAIDEGNVVAAFLKKALDTDCRLVRMTQNFGRYISPKYARNNDRVHFGDAQPLHLMNNASLADLNERLDSPVPMNRFRANIVINGVEAFAEDHWKSVRINSVDFDVPKTTGRCVITTIDQQTAQMGKEPLRTLSHFRQQENKTLMGIYLLHRQKQGVIRVGDEIHLIT